MRKADPGIVLGVDGESFLVDRGSRALASDPVQVQSKHANESAACFRNRTRTCGRGSRDAPAWEGRWPRRPTHGRGDPSPSARGCHAARSESAGGAAHRFTRCRSQPIRPSGTLRGTRCCPSAHASRKVMGGIHIHAGFVDTGSLVRVMTARRRRPQPWHAPSTSPPATAHPRTIANKGPTACWQPTRCPGATCSSCPGAYTEPMRDRHAGEDPCSPALVAATHQAAQESLLLRDWRGLRQQPVRVPRSRSSRPVP